MKAPEIQQKCVKLRQLWSKRKTKLEAWLDLALSADKYEQEELETIVANEPRTLFNMSRHLLVPKPMVHRIPVEQLEKAEAVDTASVERHINHNWKINNERYRKRGKQSWFDEFISLLLITGWYSVFMLVTDEGAFAEVWHPATFYPNFGDEGLVEGANITQLTASEANRMAAQKKWAIARKYNTPQTLYNYWTIDDAGDVVNAISLGTDVVKDETKHPAFEGVIPILCSPVGGLPDYGAIKGGDAWREYVGQSIFATNERVYDDYNRLSSFLMQLVRDTAQSRWVEKSRGEGVLTPQNVFKRGGIYKIAPDEDIYALPVPIIPVEIKGAQYSMEGQMQRGGISHMIFGSITQEVSGFTLQQIAQAAQQILFPYYSAITSVVTDIDNFWMRQERKHNIHLNGFKYPKDLPVDAEFEASFRINIPGDLVQRATAARMMNPEVKLGKATVIDLLYPEVTDPYKEISAALGDDAQAHPLALQIALIRGWEAEAALLTKLKDVEGAKLFTMAADILRKQMSAAGGEQQPQPGAAPSPQGMVTPPAVRARPEAVPPGSPEVEATR